MKIETLALGCTGCWACANGCPTDAISMQDLGEGFLYPKIDKQKCTECMRCDKICPALKEKRYDNSEKNSYYGFHKDEIVREDSSSGGVFSALSDIVIAKGGVVYGAEFDMESRRLRHTSTRLSSVEKLRRSKYVQSEIGYIFRDVKEELKQGTPVMFVGTPCQVDGLVSYLGRKYENLLTCDFVCHGVPTIKFLRDYMNELESKHNSKMVSIDFRTKVYGWNSLAMNCNFENGSSFIKSAQTDLFYSAFFSNVILRSNCFDCKYAQGGQMSDITIADFWGYMAYNPTRNNDNKGLSLIIANTNRGNGAIGSINDFEIKSLPFKYAAYIFKDRKSEPTFNKLKRDAFMKQYVEQGYASAIQGIEIPSATSVLLSRIIRLAKRVVKKAIGR